MAAPAVAVERFRVEHAEGFTIPVVSLTDRRAAGNRLVRFVFQRHLETVLYGRSEGSSGPIWKVMNTAGIGSTTLVVNKRRRSRLWHHHGGRVHGVDGHFQKSALPADVVDPCSLGRIRNCTILHWRPPPPWCAPLGALQRRWRGCARSLSRSPRRESCVKSRRLPCTRIFENSKKNLQCGAV